MVIGRDARDVVLAKKDIVRSIGQHAHKSPHIMGDLNLNSDNIHRASSSLEPRLFENLKKSIHALSVKLLTEF